MRFGPFLIIALVLFKLWAGGFVVFHTAGFLIHILLILAVISIIAHLFTAARSTQEDWCSFAAADRRATTADTFCVCRISHF